MSDFSQNGIISSLHDFGTKSTKDIEKDLLKFSKERKMELILPSLYSELEGDALPRIVSEISKVNYLSHIIIGLDRANKKPHLKIPDTAFSTVTISFSALKLEQLLTSSRISNGIKYKVNFFIYRFLCLYSICYTIF